VVDGAEVGKHGISGGRVKAEAPPTVNAHMGLYDVTPLDVVNSSLKTNRAALKDKNRFLGRM